MEVTKSKSGYGKMRRQRVEISLDSAVHLDDPLRRGEMTVHEACDIVMPTPDGRYFLIRDVSAADGAGKRASGSVDYFYPTTQVLRVKVTSKQYWIMADGSRGEEVLDKEPEKSQIIT